MADFQKLRNALAWAKKEQDGQFSMASWADWVYPDYDDPNPYPKYEELKDNPCGTQMCLAGHIVFSEGKDVYQRAAETETFDTTAVRIVLGHDPSTQDEVNFSHDLISDVFYESEYDYNDVEEALEEVMAKYAHLEA